MEILDLACQRIEGLPDTGVYSEDGALECRGGAELSRATGTRGAHCVLCREIPLSRRGLLTTRPATR